MYRYQYLEAGMTTVTWTCRCVRRWEVGVEEERSRVKSMSVIPQLWCIAESRLSSFFKYKSRRFSKIAKK